MNQQSDCAICSNQRLIDEMAALAVSTPIELGQRLADAACLRIERGEFASVRAEVLPALHTAKLGLRLELGQGFHDLLAAPRAGQVDRGIDGGMQGQMREREGAQGIAPHGAARSSRGGA